MPSMMVPSTLWISVGLGAYCWVKLWLEDCAFHHVSGYLLALLAGIGMLWRYCVHLSLGQGILCSSGVMGVLYLVKRLYSAHRASEGLGEGDILAFGASAVWFPVTHIPWFIASVGFCAVVQGALWKRSRIPLMPAMAISWAIFLGYYVLHHVF